MRKAFVVIIALLALSMLFTACASNTLTDPEPTSEDTLDTQYDQAVDQAVGDEELIGDEEYVEIGEMI